MIFLLANVAGETRQNHQVLGVELDPIVRFYVLNILFE